MTTFAVVSGVIGADLPTATILVLGVANLLADGFSMAAANYAGTKAEHDELRFFKDFESRQVEENPEGEAEEVRQILQKQGFTGDALNQAVRIFVGDKNAWIRLMLTEEHGLSTNLRTPLKAASSTFTAFLLCGTVPLLPFFTGMVRPFFVASLLTGAVFFGIGSAKSKWSLHPWWRSGLATLAIGVTASGLAYAAGAVIETLIT